MATDATEPAPANEPAPGASNGEGVSHLRRVLKIWVVLSAICVAAVILLGTVVNEVTGSSVAAFAKLTNVLFTAMAVPVALFVWVFVGYSVVVFRERSSPGEKVEDLKDGPPLQVKFRQ